VAEWHAVDTNWQLALSLIAWRETDGALRQDAFAQKLAKVAAEGGAAAVENAVLGLGALGNMFAEPYADSTGRSVDAVLADAAALEWGNGAGTSAARLIRAAHCRSGAAAGVTGGNDVRDS
jgi:hypothetical protein